MGSSASWRTPPPCSDDLAFLKILKAFRDLITWFCDPMAPSMVTVVNVYFEGKEMIGSSPSFGTVDLTNCDREPIEIPDRSSPTGFWSSFTPKPCASSRPPARPKPCSAPLRAISRHSLRFAGERRRDRGDPRYPGEGDPRPRSENLFSFELAAAGRRFDASVHAGEAGLVVELEPVDGSAPCLPAARSGWCSR